MQHPSVALRYHGEDRALRTVEDLSVHGRISRSFIRLCLDLGCPNAEGRLSLAILLDWLYDNYADVRIAGGLPPLLEVVGVPELAAAKLQMGNAMITLLEYAASRATDPVSKHHLRVMTGCVERALDR